MQLLDKYLYVKKQMLSGAIHLTAVHARVVSHFYRCEMCTIPYESVRYVTMYGQRSSVRNTCTGWWWRRRCYAVTK